jgi:hypothetical protein
MSNNTFLPWCTAFANWSSTHDTSSHEICSGLLRASDSSRSFTTPSGWYHFLKRRPNKEKIPFIILLFRTVEAGLPYLPLNSNLDQILLHQGKYYDDSVLKIRYLEVKCSEKHYLHCGPLNRSCIGVRCSEIAAGAWCRGDRNTSQQ